MSGHRNYIVISTMKLDLSDAFLKQNMLWLNLKNIRTSLKDSCFGFHNFWYHSQSCKIWALVLIRELLHRHIVSLLGKNLSLYFPIEV